MALHTGRIADTFHLGDVAKKKETAQELQPAPIGKTHADGVMNRQRLADAANLINNGLIFADSREGRDYWYDVIDKLRQKAASKP